MTPDATAKCKMYGYACFVSGYVPGFAEWDGWDPADPDMVKGVAFAPAYEVTKQEDGTTLYSPLHPDRSAKKQAVFDTAKEEQIVDFSGRRLMTNPHNGDNWWNYAVTIRDAFGRRYYFDIDGTFENAIIYGSDPVDMLDTFLLHKAFQEHLFAYRGHEMIDAIWQEIGRDTDQPTEVLCPFARACRVRETLCEKAIGSLREVCEQAKIYDQATFERLLSDARAAPQCKDLFDADRQTLWYTPVHFSEALVGRIRPLRLSLCRGRPRHPDRLSRPR